MNEKEPKNQQVEEAKDHFKNARQAMKATMESWIPSGYRENRRKARREFLLGLRKLLDAAIEHVDQHTTSPGSTPKDQ